LSCKEIFKDPSTHSKIKIQSHQVEDRVPHFIVHIDDISVRFKNPTKHHLEQQQLEQVAIAASLVWKKAMNSKKEIDIEFINYFSDRSGEKSNMIGGYFRGTGKILISLDWVFSGEFMLDMSPLQTLIFVVAHEMTHKVQDARGEAQSYSAENSNDDDYHSDPQEIEANLVALDLFKAFDPGATGHFTIGDVTYIFPQKSSFTFPKVAN
jgi:hypothetical protein